MTGPSSRRHLELELQGARAAIDEMEAACHSQPNHLLRQLEDEHLRLLERIADDHHAPGTTAHLPAAPRGPPGAHPMARRPHEGPPSARRRRGAPKQAITDINAAIGTTRERSAQRSSGALTATNLAAEAGMSRKQLYHYFGNHPTLAASSRQSPPTTPPRTRQPVTLPAPLVCPRPRAAARPLEDARRRGPCRSRPRVRVQRCTSGRERPAPGNPDGRRGRPTPTDPRCHQPMTSAANGHLFRAGRQPNRFAALTAGIQTLPGESLHCRAFGASAGPPHVPSPPRSVCSIGAELAAPASTGAVLGRLSTVGSESRWTVPDRAICTPWRFEEERARPSGAPRRRVVADGVASDPGGAPRWTPGVAHSRVAKATTANRGVGVERHFFDGVEIDYEVVGQGETVVLIHGSHVARRVPR